MQRPRRHRHPPQRRSLPAEQIARPGWVYSARRALVPVQYDGGQLPGKRITHMPVFHAGGEAPTAHGSSDWREGIRSRLGFLPSALGWRGTPRRPSAHRAFLAVERSLDQTRTEGRPRSSCFNSLKQQDRWLPVSWCMHWH